MLVVSTRTPQPIATTGTRFFRSLFPLETHPQIPHDKSGPGKIHHRPLPPGPKSTSPSGSPGSGTLKMFSKSTETISSGPTEADHAKEVLARMGSGIDTYYSLNLPIGTFILHSSGKVSMSPSTETDLSKSGESQSSTKPSTKNSASPDQQKKSVTNPTGYKVSKQELAHRKEKLQATIREQRLVLMGQDWRMEHLGIQHPKKAHRVDHVRAYVCDTSVDVEGHLSPFLHGACAVTTTFHIDAYGQHKQLGREDGTLYVTTIDAVLKLINESGGCTKEFKARLGVDWDESMEIRIHVIHNPLDYGLTMADGTEPGANERFKFGGKTKPDKPEVQSIPEAVTRVNIPKGAFTTFEISTFVQTYAAPEETVKEKVAS